MRIWLSVVLFCCLCLVHTAAPFVIEPNTDEARATLRVTSTGLVSSFYPDEPLDYHRSADFCRAPAYETNSSVVSLESVLLSHNEVSTAYSMIFERDTTALVVCRMRCSVSCLERLARIVRQDYRIVYRLDGVTAVEMAKEGGGFGRGHRVGRIVEDDGVHLYDHVLFVVYYSVSTRSQSLPLGLVNNGSSYVRQVQIPLEIMIHGVETRIMGETPLLSVDDDSTHNDIVWRQSVRWVHADFASANFSRFQVAESDERLAVNDSIQSTINISLYVLVWLVFYTAYSIYSLRSKLSPPPPPTGSALPTVAPHAIRKPGSSRPASSDYTAGPYDSEYLFGSGGGGAGKLHDIPPSATIIMRPMCDQTEMGWRGLKGDVFRCPGYTMLYCALVGGGMQVFASVTVLTLVLLSAALIVEPTARIFSSQRVTEIAIATFILASGLAGYVAGRLRSVILDSNHLKSTSWSHICTVAMTSCMLPTIYTGAKLVANLCLMRVDASLRVSWYMIPLLMCLCSFGLFVICGLGYSLALWMRPPALSFRVDTYKPLPELYPMTFAKAMVRLYERCMLSVLMAAPLLPMVNLQYTVSMGDLMLDKAPMMLYLIMLVDCVCTVYLVRSYIFSKLAVDSDWRWWWTAMTLPMQSFIWMAVYTVIYHFCIASPHSLRSGVIQMTYVMVVSFSRSLMLSFFGVAGTMYFINFGLYTAPGSQVKVM